VRFGIGFTTPLRCVRGFRIFAAPAAIDSGGHSPAFARAEPLVRQRAPRTCNWPWCRPRRAAAGIGLTLGVDTRLRQFLRVGSFDDDVALLDGGVVDVSSASSLQLYQPPCGNDLLSQACVFERVCHRGVGLAAVPLPPD